MDIITRINEPVGFIDPFFVRRTIKNRGHFKATRRKTSDKWGYYSRRSFRMWRYQLNDNEGGVFRKIKDNGDGSFTAYRLWSVITETTGLWGELKYFK